MRKTRKKGKKMKGGSGLSLHDQYGVVILPKGFRLYHVSSTNICSLPPTPFIFTTLHPSDWYCEDCFVSTIELLREVTLFFMIGRIYKLKLQSALHNLLDTPRINMIKMNKQKIKEWIPFLEKENLDGWFSSIESKTSIDFVLRNDNSIFKLVNCAPITFNWINSYYKDNSLISKSWGEEYPISTFTHPVRFILHSRFKTQIELDREQIEKEDPYGTTFYILLNNARIDYIDIPLQKISWSTHQELPLTS